MVEIRTLGELSISHNGRRVFLPTRKHYALLVYLAAHQGHPVFRDRLAAILWGESPDKKARHSLSQTLYGIRKSIPGLRLETTVHEVLLPAGSLTADFVMLCDAVDEGRYRDALALYAGKFLEGFSIPDAYDFEEWQLRQRQSIEQRIHQSLTHLLRDAEESDNWKDVDRLSERLLSIDPYHERAIIARIRAMAHLGGRWRALEEWKQIRDRFIRDIGIIPRQLRLNVVQAIAECGDQDDAALQEDDSRSSPRFVGRTEQFNRLRSAWNAVLSGDLRIVVVRGEAGIGKSRFCYQFLRLAAIQGARCFEGRCYSTESSIPFSGIADAFASRLRSADIDSLPAEWSQALTYVLPTVGTRPPQQPSHTGEEHRRRIFEAFAYMVDRLGATEPLVIFIDDFQWADHSTMATVHYIARRVTCRPILILITLRNEDVVDNHAVKIFCAEVARNPRFLEILLPEFNDDESHALIKSFCEQHNLDITKEFEGRLMKRAGGRPFFIIELLRASMERGRAARENEREHRPYGEYPLPKSITSVIERRLETLTEDEVQIVGALAVLARGASPDLLARLAATSPIAISTAIGRLVRRGIVKERGGEIVFSHDIMREAAYKWIGGYTRRTLHEHIADVLAGDGTCPEGILAVHYDLAGAKAKAFAHSLAAAEASDCMNSAVETEFYLRMALRNSYDEESKLVVLERIAHFLYRMRRHVEAEPFFDALRPYFERSDRLDAMLLAEVNRVSASLRRGQLSAEEAAARLADCVPVAETLGNKDLVSSIMRELISAAHSVSDRVAVLRWSQKLVEPEYVSEKTPNTVKNLGVAAAVFGVYKSAREGLRLADRACELCYELEDVVSLAGALRARANNRMHLGMLELAREDYQRALTIARQMENYGGLLDTLITGALIEAESGRWEEAEAIFREISQVAAETGATHESIIAKTNQLVMTYERGRSESLFALSERILADNNMVKNRWCDLTAWSILGLCALDRGAVEEARRCREEVLRRYQGKDFWISDVSYAEIFLARLSSLEGNVERAVERLEQAIAAYEDRDVLCRSRMQLERARLLRELDPAESRREAEAVLERAREMGARPLIEKAEAILAWAGGMEQIPGAVTTR